jgi:hypothetical protein
MENVLTFAAFEALYRATFAKMMSYSLDAIGSGVYCDKLADLADAYPEWAAAVEDAAQEAR